MTPNTETLLPQLVASYINSRRADFPQLASASECPCVVGPTDADETFPKIYLLNTGTDIPHPRRMTLRIAVEIQVRAEVTADDVRNQWTAAVRHILADAAAFKSFLLALTEAGRTGYRVRKTYIDAPSSAIDSEKHLAARTTVFVVQVRTDETTPA